MSDEKKEEGREAMEEEQTAQATESEQQAAVEKEQKAPEKREQPKRPDEPVSLRIIEKKTNPLMGREELAVTVSHPGAATPSRRELLQLVAAGAKVAEDVLIIERISTSRGSNRTDVAVLAYRRKEDIPAGMQEKMNRRLGIAPAEKKE